VELQRQGTEFTVEDPEYFGENGRGSGLAVSNNENSQAGEYKIQILKHMDTADIFTPFVEDEDGDELGDGQTSDVIEKNQSPEVETPSLFGPNHTHSGIPNTIIGNDTIEFIRQKSTGYSIETLTGKAGQDLFN
jgi:hypothetical protein